MIRKLLIAATMVATTAVSSFAALNAQNAEWGKGPVQWIMTADEKAAWKNISNDADAQKFIDLFWARRDPTPSTPANEFRDAFEQRVKFADERYAQGRTRGSMTDRGRMTVIFGPANRASRANVGPSSGVDDRGFGDPLNPQGMGSSQKSGRMAWIYEGDRAQQMFGAPSVELDFVDQFNTNEYKLEPTKMDIRGAEAKVINSYITQPALTAAPDFSKRAAAPVAAVAAPAAPAVAAPMTAFKTEAYQTAVNEFRAAKSNPFAKSLYVTWGEFVTGKGDYFVPVQLYVPKSAGLAAGADVTFFGIISDANGTPVNVFEEPAKLSASKDDFFVDRSLSLPAGKHTAVFGIAQNGKPVSLVSADMNLAGSIDPTAPAVSSLILSDNVYPLSAAQKPNDPYAFGGIKVVPKGDKIFTQADELWYFFEVRNPGLDDATKQPKMQVKLDLEGTMPDGKKVARSSPPSEAPTTALPGVPGHFGVGSSIPLTSFKPGDYTLKVKVTDTITKQVYTLQDSFHIVG